MIELKVSRQGLLIALAIVAFLLAFVQIKPILMPFIVGALFAYLMDPVADRLEQMKLNRTLAVSLIFVVITLFVTLLLLLVLPALFEQVAHFIKRLPQAMVWAQGLILPKVTALTGYSLQAISYSELQAVFTSHWQQASSMMTGLLKSAGSSTFSLFATLANLALIPVVGFYLLRDWDVLLAKLENLLPLTVRSTSVTLAKECDSVLSAFIRGQLLVMLGLSIIYSIGLSIVGVDVALLLGVIAGLASIVPYLGFIVGILVSSVVAYLQFQELSPLIGVALVFGVGQVLESVVLTPWLVGDKIGLHPVAVIFAIMAGGQLAGFVGVLIALPVAAMLMVLVRHAHQRLQNRAALQEYDE
jgi:predicted PurR-regulated permease PerM